MLESFILKFDGTFVKLILSRSGGALIPIAALCRKGETGALSVDIDRLALEIEIATDWRTDLRSVDGRLVVTDAVGRVGTPCCHEELRKAERDGILVYRGDWRKLPEAWPRLTGMGAISARLILSQPWRGAMAGSHAVWCSGGVGYPACVGFVYEVNAMELLARFGADNLEAKND